MNKKIDMLVDRNYVSKLFKPIIIILNLEYYPELFLSKCNYLKIICKLFNNYYNDILNYYNNHGLELNNFIFLKNYRLVDVKNIIDSKFIFRIYLEFDKNFTKICNYNDLIFAKIVNKNHEKNFLYYIIKKYNKGEYEKYILKEKKSLQKKFYKEVNRTFKDILPFSGGVN